MRWRHRRQLETETRILAAFDISEGWQYGLDLMRACKLRSGRFYPALGRLEEAELVEAKWDDTEPDRKYRRRMYRLVAVPSPGKDQPR